MNVSDIIAAGRRASGSLVHRSVSADAQEFERHRMFISSHLFSGGLAVAVMLMLALTSNRADWFVITALVWLTLPTVIAVYVARTGRLTAAHLLSSLNLAGLAAFVAFYSGGVHSFALVWLIVVPVEASLAGSKRVIAAATIAAFAALAGLYLAGEAGVLPPTRVDPAFTTILIVAGTLAAAAYVGSIAFNIHRFHARSEQSLRTNEARYRLLAENATDLITRHTGDGDVIFASGAAQGLLGCSASSLAKTGIFQRVHPEDRAIYLRALAVSLETGTASSAEFRVKTGQVEPSAGVMPAVESAPVGDYVWVEMRCRRISGSAREDGQIVAITRDITERIAQSAEMRRMRDEAQAANRAKTFFLANMSHELRTPLNAIIGFSEILCNAGVADNKQTAEYADLIHQSGAHLLQVVTDLLDMSKIDAGKMELDPDEFDLRLPVNICVRLMATTAEAEGITLVAGLPDEQLTLVADMRACKQIVINLLSNAIKFSSSGSRVWVSVERSGVGFMLSVRDEGSGIAADVLPKLGVPFIQGDFAYSRSHEGTGLGLAIVKGLAQLHGGRMDIVSSLGAGTTVSVWLPIAGVVHRRESAGENASATATGVEPAAVSVQRQAASI